jgi:hypothetical protein
MLYLGEQFPLDAEIQCAQHGVNGPVVVDSLETVCLYLPSPVTGNSAKKHSSYSARIEVGRNGAPTDVRVADGRLVFRKSEGNGFQSSIGLRSCMHPEIETGAG